jgi:UDP-glucose 4-epimerase
LRSAKRFVYTSGCLVYGSTGDTPATEDSTLHPVDLVRFRQALEDEIL